MSSAGYIVLAILVRVLWNFAFIFNWHPLIYSVLAFSIDSWDSPILTDDDKGGLESLQYQRLDKALDGVTYIFFFLWLSYYSKELWYSKLFLPMLIYRIFGNIIFIIVGKREILIFFPDLFRWFFFTMSVYDLAGADYFFRIPIVFIISNIMNVVLQVWRESQHHGPVNSGVSNEQIVAIFVGFWLVILLVFLETKKHFNPIWLNFCPEDVTEGRTRYRYKKIRYNHYLEKVKNKYLI